MNHPPRLDDHRRRVLLDAAASTIGRGLVDGERVVPDPDSDPVLAQPAATFVTLERGDALLGCIGTLEAREPLLPGVTRQAWNATFADPRLPSVTEHDYIVMTIKVSVLSTLRSVHARSWRDVRRVVVPGIDGVLVEAGRARATLLPSVWAKLPEPDEFLDVLWHKAGLRPRDWLPRTRVRRYTTEEFADPGPRALRPEPS